MAPDASNEPRAGTLFLVGTPIGNLEDMTFRAVRTLREADLIAAEDTRKARTLLVHFDIHRPTTSFFEGNERERTPQLLARLQQGASIALISEAGMPGISDPGYPLVRACYEAGIRVDVIPGPSAVVTALLLSGFPTTRFRFFGFLPRKGSARREALQSIADIDETSVVFEAPRRLEKTLRELAPLIGGRPLALVREMTKLYQETLRGSAAELLQAIAARPLRGELTIVIGERPEGASESPNPQQLDRDIRELLERGESPRTIAHSLSLDGCSRREVYQRALALAQDGDRI